jgi:8-oxo-dGTP pyrophosphatase MutT (NUDIX family)
MAMSRHAHLLDQLRSHDPADDVEAAHRESMLALLAGAASDPFSRGHFAPGHFTASCYIVDGEGRLLLHHHRRLDRWLQMGGHLENAESPELAALREGREESGLDDLTLLGGIADLDVHAIPAGKGEPDHDHFDVRYVARTATPDRITIDRAESNELAWFTLDAAADRMPGPESQRMIRKIEAMLRKGSLS